MITGQVSVDEFISAHHLHRKKSVLVADTIAVLVFITGVIVFFTTSKHWGMILVEAGIGGLIGEFVQRLVFVPWKLRRLYAQVKNRSDVSYSWNDEKIFLSSQRGNVERLWDDYTKAKENDEVILLYYNDALFEILSKCWFRERRQMDEFRRHAQLGQ